MLDRDAAAQCLDAFHIPLGYCLGMIDEPMETLQRHLVIHLFVNVKGSRDRLVISRMQPERPAVQSQQGHHRLQVLLH